MKFFKFLRKILIKSVLKRAVEFERKAYNFYDEAITRINNPEVLLLLEKLRGAELKHILKLLETLKHFDVQKNGFKSVVVERSNCEKARNEIY